MLDTALLAGPSLVKPMPMGRDEFRALGGPRTLGHVILGTTGLCNASCVHCPTGKASTAQSPRTPMPMDVFRRIVDGIADLEIGITGVIGFGLFGDGFLDPFVLERARILRSRLPDVALWVNTNAAAFNRDRHGALAGLVSRVSIHCESLVPETFDHLMQPLRAERVFPKYTEILEAFPDQVSISVPVSRRNEGEFAAIRQWFLDRGAVCVSPSPLYSRCTEDRSAFEALARIPLPIQCTPEILDHLVVDCDGMRLVCCNDFRRDETIGSLRDQSLAEVLLHQRRRDVAQLLAEGRHAEMQTCRTCYVDCGPMPV